MASCDHTINVRFVRGRRLIMKCTLCGKESKGEKLTEKERKKQGIPLESELEQPAPKTEK